MIIKIYFFKTCFIAIFVFSDLFLRIVERVFKTKSSNYLADSEREQETNVESDKATEDELESESDIYFSTFSLLLAYQLKKRLLKMKMMTRTPKIYFSSSGLLLLF